jgi:light-regulated signal transduction histidine kinase (bacteriophytochrome)
MEGQVRTQQGELKWASTSVLVTEVDDQPCLLAVTLDITHRKIAEEQLQALNKELEAFTYSVSHDLRAPLRAVNGYAQMLMEDYGSKLDDEGKRVLEAIRYNALKMGTLIDELLAFSRLGRKAARKKEVDMDHLVKNVMLELNKLVKHNATVTIGKLHTVQAEHGLLHQVMYNLVSNAIKYSSKRKDPVVEIFSEEKNGDIIFSVKDNGAGFDMQYADKLFGVFQRLHSQEEFEGTGVGLAIVQRVIAKHGGKVWAEGKKNEGAIFYFSLPKN